MTNILDENFNGIVSLEISYKMPLTLYTKISENTNKKMLLPFIIDIGTFNI